MARLRMDPERLRISAAQMRDLSCEMQELIKRVQYIMMCMQEGWEAEESAVYADQVAQKLPACNELAQILEQYAQAAATTANSMEGAESMLADQISSIFRF